MPQCCDYNNRKAVDNTDEVRESSPATGGGVFPSVSSVLLTSDAS